MPAIDEAHPIRSVRSFTLRNLLPEANLRCYPANGLAQRLALVSSLLNRVRCELSLELVTLRLVPPQLGNGCMWATVEQ